ncbi:MAG TPA: response regulator [Candidatus Paceibacterota bacterium]
MANKPLILFVDDSEDFRDIFSTKLTAEGFDVVTAVNGEDALEKLKNINPEVILLDLEMPVMNGVETLLKIRSDDKFKNAKVLFCTNYGEPKERAAWTDEKFAKEIGAIGYLRKTDDLDTIAKQVKAYASTSININR